MDQLISGTSEIAFGHSTGQSEMLYGLSGQYHGLPICIQVFNAFKIPNSHDSSSTPPLQHSPTDCQKGSNATVASTVGSDEEICGDIIKFQYMKTNNTGSTSTHVDVSRPRSGGTRSRRCVDSDMATTCS
jgi:hypothetical protein